MKPEKIVETITNALDEKKAEDLEVFDLRNRESVTDFMVICTGNSMVHIRALKDHVKRELKTTGLNRIAEAGLLESNWIILDYGQVIIHILGPEERVFYRLEALWKDARVVYH